ncbi:unnamed protein product [Prorocentrum cordatum]|uniref:Uncharacterized protein n=1 Tax=Prorocentrum cordatum TaxID=2364126 RepID=A0ABN9UAQ1_9DINO|nr:unnamed protein product [Polarella glacialis]
MSGHWPYVRVMSCHDVMSESSRRRAKYWQDLGILLPIMPLHRVACVRPRARARVCVCVCVLVVCVCVLCVCVLRMHSMTFTGPIPLMNPLPTQSAAPSALAPFARHRSVPPLPNPSLYRFPLQVYQGRLRELAEQVAKQPPAETLDTTLRRCIAFIYKVTPEWAPHVRVTVFADNPSEHQTNVPIYDTLLVTWGLAAGSGLDTRCRPVPGTDVSAGQARASPFWTRSINVGTSNVLYRDLVGALLHWFLSLADDDRRKLLLDNMLLQLHEACYNCIGRHKEVFEYCMYDLLDAEASTPAAPKQGATDLADDLAGARRAVLYHAARVLDRHKREALHGAILSPLKLLYRDDYKVFENLDSHGTSFWSTVLTEAFFPGLQMPFEAIRELDSGWSWGAVDFLPVLQGSAAGRRVLDHFSALENLGRDWHSLSKEVSVPPGASWQARRLPAHSFVAALAEARRPSGRLREALEPYAARFAELMRPEPMLHRCALALVGSERWGAELGPALSALTPRLWARPWRPRRCASASAGTAPTLVRWRSTCACAGRCCGPLASPGPEGSQPRGSRRRCPRLRRNE